MIMYHQAQVFVFVVKIPLEPGVRTASRLSGFTGQWKGGGVVSLRIRSSPSLAFWKEMGC
jgi:hypothetical protein